jgi:hypothetical protein
MANDNQLEDILETETVASNQIILSSIVIVISVLIILYKLVFLSFLMPKKGDEPVVIVECPKNSVMDVPILLRHIPDLSNKQRDSYVAGVVRNYLIYKYPRTKQDVKPFLEYDVAHTTGTLKYYYKSLLENYEQVETLIGDGFGYYFYPTSSQDIRIEMINETKWKVQVPGYLLVSKQGGIKRTNPTIDMTLEACKSSMSNPQGLCLSYDDEWEYGSVLGGKKESLGL